MNWRKVLQEIPYAGYDRGLFSPCAVTPGVENCTPGKYTVKTVEKNVEKKIIQSGLRTGRVHFSLHPDG
jgi:hypothetical protein